MIEIVLTCDVCGIQSEPHAAGIIDRYEYHDAPGDAVVVNYPPRWGIDPDPWKNDMPGLLALCPLHNTKEFREEPWRLIHRRAHQPREV